MPLPKRRTSKARRDKRRTHQKLSKPGVTTCPQCGEPVLSHRACKKCGFYKGESVLKVAEEK